MKFTSIILSLWLALAVHAQYVTGDYTATIGEVLDGLNQNKPVTPWGLSHAGFASSNSGMITNNYTGVVNLTNSANKFVGSFTVPEGATIKVTGISFPDATNGVWHFSYSRSSEAGSGTAYVFTNAINPYYIIYDVTINSGWYYSSSPDSSGGQCNSGSTTNWLDWYGGFPIDFQAKLGGVSIINANPVPTIPKITLAVGSGGIVDNSANGYTGKRASFNGQLVIDTSDPIYGDGNPTLDVSSAPDSLLAITGALLLNGALYDSTGSGGASGDVPTSTGSGWSWQTPSGGSFPLVGANGYIYLADNGTTASSVAGYFQVKDNGNGNSAFPTSGAGVEMTAVGTNSYFQAYDRDNSQFMAFTIQAAPIIFTSIGANITFGTTGGGKLVLVNSSGDLEFNNGTCGFSKANNRVFQKTPNGTKVYLHLTDPVLGASTATWTTTP